MELRPRVIKGFSDYVIYPDGRVYSCKRHQIMKPHLTEYGYYRIGLTDDKGKPKKKLIHRLIAEHFIDNPENKSEVDHIDRNKQNNNISNLRWVSRSENCQNKGIFKTNTSGIKYISFDKSINIWKYEKVFNGKLYTFRNKNKILVICYKYIHILKLKAKLFDKPIIQRNNTSGMKNIGYDKINNNWRYEKVINAKRYTFYNENKQIVLWCKFVHSLLS